jgi:hypothetical protein
MSREVWIWPLSLKFPSYPSDKTPLNPSPAPELPMLSKGTDDNMPALCRAASQYNILKIALLLWA